MIPTYVVSSDSLVAISTECTQTGAQGLLAQMSTLAAAGRLLFPPEVLKECLRWAPIDPATIWATPTQATLVDSEAPWNRIEDVLDPCPELLDVETDETPVSVPVLALALHRRAHQATVRVVTEDIVDGPDTISLHTACGRLAIEALTIRDFAHEVGCSAMLKP